MDLYLVRHAIAHKRDPERWPDDANRPLTPEGEERFVPVAHALAKLAAEVEAVLSSPYARAWRTAELLAEEAAWPAPGVFPALEPDVPPEKALIALETYAPAETVALVGHRPSQHELASYLLTGDAHGLDFGLKKGAAALIRFDGPPEPGAGRLRWLLTPKLLRDLIP